MKTKSGTNLIEATEKEVLKAGYKFRRTLKMAPGDLLCGTNQAKDLWIELDKFAISRIESLLDLDKSLVLGKKKI